MCPLGFLGRQVGFMVLGPYRFVSIVNLRQDYTIPDQGGFVKGEKWGATASGVH